MSDVVVVAGSEGEEAGGAYQAIATLNEGFLGTGYSTSVEISFILMGLIACYVVVSTARYFLEGTRVLDSVAGALGFSDK